MPPASPSRLIPSPPPPALLSLVYVTSGVILGFLLHPLHHLDPAWIALLGAILLCVFSEPHEVHELLHVSVDSKCGDSMCGGVEG